MTHHPLMLVGLADWIALATLSTLQLAAELHYRRQTRGATR